MTSKIVIIACVQALLVQAAFSQLIPQQLVSPCQTKYLQNVLPNVIAPLNIAEPCGAPTVASYPQVPTTVIQDSSVSNNLANALQLLVVSSLLSNTLPFNQPCGYGSPVVEQFVQQPLVNYGYPQVINAPNCGCNGMGGFVGIY